MGSVQSSVLGGLKILVVDDAPDNRLLISRFLTLAGASVVVSDNATDGIAIALQGQFNLVLMDIQMPVMDGIEAIGRLRRLNYRTPVVALTAHAMSSDRSRCLASGFDAYLTKPIARAQLISTVSQLVGIKPEKSAAFIQNGDTLPDPVLQHERQAKNQNPDHTGD